MSLSQEIRKALAAKDYDRAQAICEQMRGAQAHNWQVKIDGARALSTSTEISSPTSGAVSAHNDKSLDGARESDTALPPTAGASVGARRASEAAMAGNDSRGGVPLRSSCPATNSTAKAEGRS